MIPAPVVQVWDATGSTALGAIAAVESMTISDVRSDIGSIELNAPRSVVGMDLLATDEDRQIRVRMQGAPDMWFLLDDDACTWISDDRDSETTKVTGRSLAAILDEAVVIPSGGVGATPAEWAFTAPTPGEVIEDLFASAQSRGLLQNITLDGDATNDASGTPWPESLPDTTYRAGTTLLQVLKGLVDQELVEWRMNGRILEVHRVGGDLDRTLPAVVLRPGRDVKSAPLQRSRRSVATAVLVEGADGENARRTQVLTGRRAREIYVSQSSADVAILDDLGDLYLGAHGEADVQITHELDDGPDTPRPWVDYRPGDRLPTLAAGPSVQTRRVSQVALKWADSVSVTLELGSLLATAEERLVAEVRRLAPGAASLA